MMNKQFCNNKNLQRIFCGLLSMTDCIQGHSGGNVNISVADSISHCEKNFI